MRRGGIRRPPYASTLLASALALGLLGGLALVGAQGERLRRELRESLAVVVELRPSAPEATRAELGSWLGEQAFVRERSVEYVDAEAGAERLRDRYGEEFLGEGLDNPLFDLYAFRLAAGHTSAEAVAAATERVGSRDGVLAVYAQDDYAARLVERLASLGYGGLAVGLALLLATGYLVVNTARLALLDRREVIRNMELVGASWGFIARPFLWRAAVVGATAGALASLACWGLERLAAAELPALWRPVDPRWLALGSAGLIALGLLLNLATTFLVIRRTLRLRVDDLD